MNPSLAVVLEKAKHANMPKANIERAIARAADKESAALIEETYEAYGPGGVGIIIEVATDNRNRTMPEVRTALSKNGGRMADQGSVMFQFDRKGVIEISEKGDDAMMLALDAGAEDATEEDEGIEIITASSDLMSVRQKLLDNNLTVTSAELKYLPKNEVALDEDQEPKLMKLLDALDDLDDVFLKSGLRMVVDGTDGNVIRYNSAVVVNLFAVNGYLAAPVFLGNEPAVGVQVRAGEVVEENLGIFRKNSGFRECRSHERASK